MIQKIKRNLYICKEWLRRIYIYPQNKITAGQHFNYDEYWKNKRGSNYIGSLGRWQQRRAEIASAIISKNGGQSVNDIGSGAGEVLLYIRNHTRVSKTICYDNSEYALSIAKSRGLETRRFDINNNLDYAVLEPVDYTIMFEILEHVAGSEELLRYAYDHSKKGVLFTFPNTGFFIHRVRLFFFGRFPLEWTKHPAEHLRFWTKRDLIWWLEAQDYEQYQVNYYVGVPILKDLWPSVFAAGFFVYLQK